MGNIYIEVDSTFRVTKIHRMPFDPTNGMGYTREELEKKGFFVKEVPNPVNKTGKRAIAMYNPDTKSIYHEYVNVPLSNKERVDLMENALNNIIKNGTYGMATYGLRNREEDDNEKDIADYMAYQVITGKMSFDECVTACPRYENEIKKILADNGIQV